MHLRAVALESLQSDGACIWPASLEEARLQDLESRLGGSPQVARRPVGLEPLQAWLRETFLPELVGSILGLGARPVRALLMGKGDGENWAIAFHKDTTIAVKECGEVPGFGPWVNKAHFYQTQAPASVMEGMLATRIHLDDCGPENGPLEVIAGSHGAGRLTDADISRWIETGTAVSIAARRGGVVLLRPLALHGSERATSPSPRRVLHIEWSAVELPGGLEWAWF